jgi:ABC-type dipeptide/oligopeptide/nickel transport system ATPase component
LTILNIRGASGSGKSTLARRLMDAAPGPKLSIKKNVPTKNSDTAPTQKVIGYLWPDVKFAVFGRYDTPAGGVDCFSFKDARDWVLEQITLIHRSGYNVMYEGIMASMYSAGAIGPWNRANGETLHVIHLSTTLEECLASIDERKRVRGKNDKPVNANNIASNFRGIQSNSNSLKAILIPVESLDREAAFVRAKELLNLDAPAISAQRP